MCVIVFRYGNIMYDRLEAFGGHRTKQFKQNQHNFQTKARNHAILIDLDILPVTSFSRNFTSCGKDFSSEVSTRVFDSKVGGAG